MLVVSVNLMGCLSAIWGRSRARCRAGNRNREARKYGTVVRLRSRAVELVRLSHAARTRHGSEPCGPCGDTTVVLCRFTAVTATRSPTVSVPLAGVPCHHPGRNKTAVSSHGRVGHGRGRIRHGCQPYPCDSTRSVVETKIVSALAIPHESLSFGAVKCVKLTGL
jgi:hypothetical protein